MKGIFRNRKLFTFTCVFLAFMVSVISFFQYHNAMQVEARDIVKNIVIQSSLYVPRDEIVSERTENSKKYYLGNNSYALDISMAAIHYKDNYSDKQEQWKDIDLTFENGLITKAPYILSVDQDNKSFTVQDKKTGQTTTVRLTRIGNQDVQQIEKKAGAISKGKIQWNDVATDLDLSITAENTKVSFDWIVKSENAPHEVQFEIEDGGIPIIYRGVDADGKEVEVSLSKSGNTMTETIQKGGKYPKTINPTLDLDVGASTDDRMFCWLNGSWFIEAAQVYAGRTGYVNWVLNRSGSGLRWTGITIPAGSTIDAAWLTVVSFSSISDTTVNSRITGNKENNPATWSSLANYKARRGTVVGGANNNYITTAQVSWDNVEGFEEGNSYNSPEIKTVIQELIDAHAPSNEAMALFWDDHEGRSTTEEGVYRTIRTYDYGYPPELHIEYTEPPPQPPDNVEATDGDSTNEIQITWDASSGADDYNIYRDTSPSPPANAFVTGYQSTTYNDTSAEPGTPYWYWVKAHSENGYSDYSSYNSGWRKLSAPATVNASDGEHTDKVVVSWDASTGATEYHVYRNNADNPPANELDTVYQTTTYNDTSATAGTTYYYWVKASCTNGDSDFSSPDTGWMKLTAPGIVAASDGGFTDKVQITWSESSGATSYKVYRNTTNDSGTASQIGIPTQASYDDTSADPGTTYYYWVKASCTNGDSDFSSPPNTGWRKLTAPTSVQATDGTDTAKVQISWTGSSGATGYKVYRNTTNDSGTATQIGTPSQTPYDDTSATPGVTYYYWVKASCTNGDSDFSSPNTGWRKLTAPTNVQATDGSYDNDTQISWTGSSGATAYKVYRNTTYDSGTATKIGEPTQTPYDDTTGLSGVTYYYWVKASCTNGDSDFSSPDTGWGKPHRNWGTNIKDSSTIPGIYGKRSLFKNYQVPSANAFLYAPTFIGPYKCPLEISSKYYYYGGYKRTIGFYDFNTSSWTEYSGDDVDPYLNGTYYYAEILYNWESDGKWHAELYNYQAQAWQSKREASPDRNDALNGWDIFEEYNFSESSWPSLGYTFESDLLKVYDGGWTYCTSPTYGEYSINNMGTAPYTRAYAQNENYYHWTVTD